MVITVAAEAVFGSSSLSSSSAAVAAADTMAAETVAAAAVAVDGAAEILIYMIPQTKKSVVPSLGRPIFVTDHIAYKVNLSLDCR